MSTDLVSVGALTTDEVVRRDGSPILAINRQRENWQGQVLRAKNEASDQGVDFLNQEIEVEGVMVHKASRVNSENGELNEWVRTVLFLGSGYTVSFGSAGIFQSIRDFAAIFGDPPWSPAIKVKVRAKALDKGRHWYWLEPV